MNSTRAPSTAGTSSTCVDSELLESQLRQAHLGILVCAALALVALIVFLVGCVVAVCRQYAARREAGRGDYDVELQVLTGSGRRRTRPADEIAGEVGIYCPTPQQRSPVATLRRNAVGASGQRPLPPPPRPSVPYGAATPAGFQLAGLGSQESLGSGYGYATAVPPPHEPLYSSPYGAEGVIYANTSAC